MFQRCDRRIRDILTQPQPEPLAIPIRTQEPQRRARQHRTIQCLIPIAQLRPLLAYKAASVLHLMQLFRHQLLDPFNLNPLRQMHPARWKFRRLAAPKPKPPRKASSAAWISIASQSMRAMVTRWASLSPTGLMSVNPDLIRAPLMCIEYVLVHELCHLEHPHQGPAFWRLLARRMPDWQERKVRLERTLA